MKWNLGCGTDIKEGWFNTNHQSHVPVEGAVYLDALVEHFDMYEKFDFVLVNHVFCTLSYDEVDLMLRNIYRTMQDGATIEIIDMNPLKAFRALERGDVDALPGFEGSIDNRFTRHLVGFGRKSLWTPDSVCEALERAGFKNPLDYHKSGYDLRPKESLVVKATK